MECKVYQELVSEFAAASTSYFAAASKLFALTALHGDGRSFSEAYEKARQERERCSRARDAVERHRSLHHCSGDGHRTSFK